MFSSIFGLFNDLPSLWISRKDLSKIDKKKWTDVNHGQNGGREWSLYSENTQCRAKKNQQNYQVGMRERKKWRKKVNMNKKTKRSAVREGKKKEFEDENWNLREMVDIKIVKKKLKKKSFW